MEKEILLVDFDNTIVDWVVRLNGDKRFNNALDPITGKGPYETNLLKANPKFKDQILEAIGQQGFTFVDEDNCLPAFPGAIETLHELDEYYDVYICSANDKDHIYNASEKVQWVRHNLGGKWVDKLILCKAKNLVRGKYLLDDSNSYTTKSFSPAPIWEHIPYGYSYPVNWKQVGEFFIEEKKCSKCRGDHT